MVCFFTTLCRGNHFIADTKSVLGDIHNDATNVPFRKSIHQSSPVAFMFHQLTVGSTSEQLQTKITVPLTCCIFCYKDIQ